MHELETIALQSMFLSIPLVGAVAAWLISARLAEAVWRLAQGLVFTSVVLWVALLATGVAWQPGSLLSSLHGSVGHWLVLDLSFATGLCAGWVARWEFRPWPVRSVAWLLFFIFTLAVSYSNALTGYLGPSAIPDLGTDEKMLFDAIHRFLDPVLLGTMLAIWSYKFARYRRI